MELIRVALLFSSGFRRVRTPAVSSIQAAKFRAARLIVNLMAGFIQTKFQYVALLCHVDCHVKRSGQNQENKSPFHDLKGAFVYQENAAA